MAKTRKAGLSGPRPKVYEINLPSSYVPHPPQTYPPSGWPVTPHDPHTYAGAHRLSDAGTVRNPGVNNEPFPGSAMPGQPLRRPADPTARGPRRLG